ncbi:ATP-dependent Clp protease proteolytic subunit [Agromyces protaetiae]|uniref:ATP-dependent Clp protease proteolytic subunit n=1 Tax=Agromyces protaetiae TaxID=2509455 RepID=A0A4P6FR22_9MICO|nr:ATP-dependent Clp protease proteolytic subunit [Agromyces protaetiae]QAY72978.1 ATP-dependent Clp protease proteolytic subunit [Agromyces protaetiae]
MSEDTAAPLHPIDVDLQSRLFRERVVVLGDELDQNLGNRLTSQLLMLSADDPERDIAFWINSPGGSVPAMLAIMDVMHAIPNDVVTVALGMAASAGQFLLSAGTPGKRLALPHARILMHQGSAGIGGTAVDIELQAEDLRHTRDTVLGLLAAHTGQSIERITADSLRDRWITADEAVEYGFIDRVVTDASGIYPGASGRLLGPGFRAADVSERAFSGTGAHAGALA